MELTTLGYDDWFEERAIPFRHSGRSLARVTAVDRDAFLLRDQHRELPAELAGRLRFAVQSAVDLPCVGDWVCAQGASAGGPALIHEVLPRKTFLRRKSPGRSVDVQMIAANLDVAFIPLSNTTGLGVEQFRECLAPGKTYCLLGSSAVS